ncbi:MAG: YcxB family protein [Pseudobutyrivibrio sp.]|nr:YcxB family protein [Pseudobutyrivibrio sp.]
MGQNIKFSVQISEDDLYKYNLHHAYTSTQGIFSIVLFVLLIAVWVLKFPDLSPVYKVAYPLVAVIFLFYIPMNLKLRVKSQMTQEVFMHPLNYELTDTGVIVSSPAADEPSELPWEYIYKISTWKGYLLIYSNRVNAYIVPIKDIEGQYDEVIAYIQSHVEDYRLKL